MANFNFNKAMYGGRLTADPELKQTPTGISVCRFTVAVNRKAGKDKEQATDFISCVAWRNTAELVCKYFKKGSSIFVVGETQTRSYTANSGEKRSATELNVNEVNFVDSKSDGDSAPAFSVPSYSAQQPTPGFEEITPDDNLPF